MKQGLSSADLIALVQSIMNGEGTHKEQEDHIRLLQHNVPHPGVLDLIFWPNREMTPEEVVLEALSYKPLITPPHPVRMERPGPTPKSKI